MSSDICRFAPSTTGLAHPGTLLAALVCWLDARKHGARLILRLEDLDPDRCRPEFAQSMIADLAWFGLEFDAIHWQSQHKVQHEQALDTLEAAGLLYPCNCSRAQISAVAKRAADGGFAYPNTCRKRSLGTGGWRSSKEPLRVQLPDNEIDVEDESGMTLRQVASKAMGDPIVRRRDGAMSYQLAVVVDDGAAGVTRIVRGRDIAPSTATQVAIQHMLRIPTPTYRHHLLLCEKQGQKLAKFHRSVGVDVLKQRYSAPELLGIIAHAADLKSEPAACTLQELLDAFNWTKVRTQDRLVIWDANNGGKLYADIGRR